MLFMFDVKMRQGIKVLTISHQFSVILLKILRTATLSLAFQGIIYFTSYTFFVIHRERKKIEVESIP